MSDDAQSGGLPALDFSGFIISLGHSALINLGEMPHPELHQVHQDLEAAQQTIDILAMLQEKTRGNLTHEEESLLGKLVLDLRMKFVQASKS